MSFNEKQALSPKTFYESYFFCCEAIAQQGAGNPHLIT
jgi:hypothetical protein